MDCFYICRGGMVNQEALLDALQNNKIKVFLIFVLFCFCSFFSVAFVFLGNWSKR